VLNARLSDESDPARDFYEKGRAAMKEGRLEEAIRCFVSSIASYLHFKALELLGEWYIKMGSIKD
jgi:outer membrane protein assembly factor BamD (BamD/ComL family)